MKIIALIISFALAACLFPSIGAAADQASNQSAYTAPVANDSARAGLVSFLEEAKNYTLNNGKDEALKAFSDPNGKFVRGDMYVFAYDFNGTLLAHPYLSDKIGRNNLDLLDPNGVPIIKNMVEVAKQGEGFAVYVYPNPNEANQTGLKLVYALKVDDGLWIGSGIYLPGQVPLFSFEDQRRLSAFVNEAKDYALKNGRDKALQAFNDPNGEFVRGDLYIFAYDFLGNALSLPFQHNLLGTNRLNVTDSNGLTVTGDNLELARTGSGQTYYLYPNPREDMREELKLSYTTKVDDSWWLGAGIYSSSSSAQNLSAMKPSNREELKTFVDEAHSQALFVGKEKALKEFMDLKGTWVRGDVYIFAHDFNGTTLCLPYMPEGVGTNRMDIQNDQGVYINREMNAIAMNGSGYYEYKWKNPISNQSQPKVSYVSKVDDTWWLGAGIYEA
ncbi:MAG TPA: cache domain-containing protein [Methanotrichaceae archaeon]|nr:cache domain-containing protein [Methanotrichaceae archaeon]